VLFAQIELGDLANHPLQAIQGRCHLHRPFNEFTRPHLAHLSRDAGAKPSMSRP
jgi:hypothetical protein